MTPYYLLCNFHYNVLIVANLSNLTGREKFLFYGLSNSDI